MFVKNHLKMQHLLVTFAWLCTFAGLAFWLWAKYRMFQLATKKNSDQRKLWMKDGYRYTTLCALLLALSSSILAQGPLWKFLLFYLGLWAIGTVNIYLWGKRPLSKWSER